MRFFGRQDLLLIAALTTALVIVFSSSISRLLDYAREIERQSGLTLVPALVLLTGAFFFHQYRRTPSAAGQGRSGRCWRPARPSIAPKSSSGWSRSARRWHDRSTSTAFASRSRQHLPAIAGTDSVWVLVQQGSEWQALAGDTRGAEEVLQWGDLAEQLLASGPDKTPSRLPRESRDRLSADRRRQGDGRARRASEERHAAGGSTPHHRGGGGAAGGVGQERAVVPRGQGQQRARMRSPAASRAATRST